MFAAALDKQVEILLEYLTIADAFSHWLIFVFLDDLLHDLPCIKE